jgi:hypothetical protein
MFAPGTQIAKLEASKTFRQSANENFLRDDCHPA